MIQVIFTFEEWKALVKDLTLLQTYTKDNPKSLIDLQKKVDKIKFEGETIIIGKKV